MSVTQHRRLKLINEENGTCSFVGIYEHDKRATVFVGDILLYEISNSLNVPFGFVIHFAPFGLKFAFRRRN